MSAIQPIALSVTGAARFLSIGVRQCRELIRTKKLDAFHVAERPNPRLNRVVPKIPRELAAVQKSARTPKPDAALIAAVASAASVQVHQPIIIPDCRGRRIGGLARRLTAIPYEMGHVLRR